MNFSEGFSIVSQIIVRPYAMEIISALKAKAEIIVFTASEEDYAQPILDYLDPTGTLFDHRFFRPSCLQAPDGRYVKDLRIFGNRDLKDVVLIDNSAFSYGAQIPNGIPCLPFFYNKADTELKDLYKYLKLIGECYDVRTFNKEAFKLHTCAQHATAASMLESIFK
jgi:CTD small phosphatase-like protein 2